MSQPESSEPPSTRLGVVILAAGQGTRMRSGRPKVLHTVAGQPMVQHVLAVAGALAAAETVVVIAPGERAVREAVSGATVVEQAQQLGTGHALLQAREVLLGRAERLVVLLGDGPLIRPATVRRLVDELEQATIAMLTVELDDPTGYGRIVRREPGGAIVAIVEEAVADAPTRAIREVWSGQMAFDAEWLWEHLARLPERAGGEYYLTDLIEAAVAEGQNVRAVPTDQPDEALGINTQADLARWNRLAWDRETARLMANGVTVLDPATTYVEPGVEVGAGSVLHPNTHLQGATRVGLNCQIGPNSIVVNSRVGDGSRVWSSLVEGSELEADVQVGPFAHVRPGCYLEREVHLGNYAEAKASRIGRGTQVHHFSYLGDADLGQRVNVGAGTVTCNFDGRAKHRTVIGDDAFIGSDSLLIAPVTIGDRALTGAGSVVTRDVPTDGRVVGMPARAAPNPANADPTELAKDGE